MANSSTSFINLLASQGIIDLDSSEPPFVSSEGVASQCSDEATVKERRKWTPKEDIILIGAWLNTSKDPIVSNEQKGLPFWKRILDNYNSSLLVVGTIPRELGQVKQRWARINDVVCKFCGSYEMAQREQRSGQNDNDVMKAALEIFFNDKGFKFNLEHAWRELRHDVKWCSTSLGKDNGKDNRKTGASDAGGSVIEPQERPIGVKAAKAAGKRKKLGKEEELGQLKDLMETKKQISDQSLLASLFAKTDPLTEMEIALKMKLMSQML